MAFKELDQLLIDECDKSIINFEKIKALIIDGANVNAFDKDFEQSLYEDVLDYYIDGNVEEINLANLLSITQLFIENDLILNPKPDDCDYFIPRKFRFLPPEKICVNAFKLLLENGSFSFDDIENFISDASLDLHLGEFYFFEGTKYSWEDSEQYFLELVYWACAYNVKENYEKCSKDLLEINWFKREQNKIELIRENRSTSVFVEDLNTHKRTEIDGWTMKY